MRAHCRADFLRLGASVFMLFASLPKVESLAVGAQVPRSHDSGDKGAHPLASDRASLVAETYRFVKEIGPTVRPGFDGSSTPLVLVDGDFEFGVDLPGSWKDAVPTSAAPLAGHAARSRTTIHHSGLGKSLALDRFSLGCKDRGFEKGVWLEALLEEGSKQP